MWFLFFILLIGFIILIEFCMLNQPCIPGTRMDMFLNSLVFFTWERKCRNLFYQPYHGGNRTEPEKTYPLDKCFLFQVLRHNINKNYSKAYIVLPSTT